MKTLSNLTPFEIFTIIISVFIAWSMLKGVWLWLFKKRKSKTRKEYQVRIFLNDRILEYKKDNIQKVRYYGKKYIAIKTADGSWDKYEGFSYILNVNKINESPIV